MKNIKKKLTVSLLAISCMGISAGASIATQNYSAQGITANAEGCEEYVLGAVTDISGGTEVCLSFANGEAGQIDDMDCPLECVNGIGVTLNGVAVSSDSLKESGDQLYITVADSLNWGDELRIGGEFHQEDYGVKYLIDESVFYWDGSAWVTELGEQPVGYTVYNVDAIRAENSSNATTLYITPFDGDGNSFGVGDWDNCYTLEAGSGAGLKLNDTALSTTDIKQPGSFFIALGVEAVAGDVLTIDGVYYNETTAKKIVFNNCQLQFNGSAWVKYVEYTTYTVDAIRAEDSSNATTLYLTPADGDGNSFGVGDWDNVYAFEAGSGAGLKLNDTALSTTDIKQPGSFFIALDATAVEGDVLTIDGVYYNETTAKKFVFNNCTLVFNGTTWVAESEEEPETPEDPIEYTVYNVDAIRAENSSDASTLYLTPADGDGNSFGVGDWDNCYTFEVGSGAGLKLNDTALSTTDIKQPGSFFIALGATAVEGDVLTIDGVYYNETTAKKFVFNNCTLTFDGSAWVGETAEDPVDPPVVEYTTYEIGALILHVNSTVGGASGMNNVLYLQRADEEALPVLSWDHAFAYESGDGFHINGDVRTPIAIKSTGDGFYLEFDALNAGDVVSISGTFVCDTQAARYVIEESKFVWNGSGWEAYVEPETPVEYTVYNIEKVNGANGCSASVLYAYSTDGDSFPEGDWDNVYTFEAGSGAGLKLNDTALSTTDIKQPGDFFINLGVNAVAGDVLTIDGAYYNNTTAKKFVFNNCTLTFDGSTWVGETAEEPVDPPVEPPVVEYTVYNVDAIRAEDSSNATTLYITPADGDGNSFGVGDWDNVYAFEVGSGAGLKLNETALSTTDIKQPGSFFIVLGVEAVAGDVLTIDGAYYNETTAKKIVFNNCTLTYTNGAWVGAAVEEPEEPEEPETPVEYTVYNINKIAGANGCSASVLYAYSTDGDSFPEGDWDNVYTFEAGSGAGLKLNDTALSTTDIKQPGDFFINLGVNAVAGDVLTIDGVYYNETTAKKFVFNNCTLTFDGSTWVGETAEDPVDPPVEPPVVEYTTYEIGAVEAISGDVGVYLAFAEGVSLPVDSWVAAFARESGNGITINGEEVYMENNLKSVGGKLYVTVAVELTEGDTLVIGGTFYNAEYAVKYVIEEKEFFWNGRSWVTSLNYTTYELGELVFHVNSTVGGAKDVNTALYLKMADDATLPVNSWDNAYLFFYEEGAGFKVNGEAANLIGMKSVGEFIYLEFEALQAGDVVSFGGTYVCDGALATYVIDEGKYVWTGSAWEAYVEYTTYEVGKVVCISADESAIYLGRADGEPFDIVSTENDVNWTTAFSFLADSGVGVTLNGVVINMSDIKFPHDMYIGLGGVVLNKGDVFVIGGTFYSPDLAVKYVIEESTMVYDGETLLDTFTAYRNDAKAELDTYKANFAEADYYAGQWAEMEAALTAGKAAIDGSKTEAEVIAAVEAAKADMDKVMTKTEVDASLAGVKEAAKADIASYKAESDYRAAEWATIQGILAAANTKIDTATSEAEILDAAADAKVEMDAVKTAGELEVEEVNALRTTAKAEVRSYYEALDLSQYSQEAIATISGYVSEAQKAIDAAATKAAIEAAVAQYKANVDSVEKNKADDSQTTTDSSSTAVEDEGGCFSTASGGVALGGLGLAAAIVSLRKKKEND